MDGYLYVLHCHVSLELNPMCLHSRPPTKEPLVDMYISKGSFITCESKNTHLIHGFKSGVVVNLFSKKISKFHAGALETPT